MRLEIIALGKLVKEYGQQYVEEHIQASVDFFNDLSEETQDIILTDSPTWMPASEGNNWPLFINDVANKDAMLEFAVIIYDSREYTYHVEYKGRIKG